MKLLSERTQREMEEGRRALVRVRNREILDRLVAAKKLRYGWRDFDKCYEVDLGEGVVFTEPPEYFPSDNLVMQVMLIHG